MPANAGIQARRCDATRWMPAFAGMTIRGKNLWNGVPAFSYCYDRKLIPVGGGELLTPLNSTGQISFARLMP